MQGALKNEPELGALPNALDFIKNDADRKVMELHFTQKTAARPLVAPPEVPAERVAHAAQGVRDAGAGQGVPRRNGQGQDGVRLRVRVRRSTRSWRRSPRRRRRSPSATPRHFPPTESNGAFFTASYPALSATLACAASSAGSRAGSPRAMPHSVPMPSTRAWRRAAAESRRVAAGVIVMHKAEIKLGLRTKLQVLQRRKVGVVGARLDHRHMEELDRPLDSPRRWRWSSRP